MYYKDNSSDAMRTISLRLDEETDAKLAEIMIRMGSTNQSELIKRLINERWIALAPGKTFLERRGGHPQYLLQGPSNLSDRKVRKALVAEHYEERRGRRKST